MQYIINKKCLLIIVLLIGGKLFGQSTNTIISINDQILNCKTGSPTSDGGLVFSCSYTENSINQLAFIKINKRGELMWVSSLNQSNSARVTDIEQANWGDIYATSTSSAPGTIIKFPNLDSVIHNYELQWQRGPL